jgi:hypothetical protein
MISRTFALALLAPCLLAAAPAAALPAWVQPDGDPPVLAEGASAEDIAAWKGRHLIVGPFAEATTDANRVTLYDPASLARLGNDHVIAIFRSELFRPRIADGHWLRSIRKKLEIDCTGLLYRELELYGFAGSNMTAPVPPLTPPDKWVGPFAADSSAGEGLRIACDKAPPKG